MMETDQKRRAAKAVAMVLLDTARPTDGAAVVGALSGRRSATLEHSTDTLVAITVEGEPSMIGLVRAPIPWSQLAGPCSTAWWWPDAERSCRSAEAHLVVMTSDTAGGIFDANLRLTDIVSAVSELPGVRAIYWGAGTLVHEPGAFRAEAATATRGLLPLRLWVDLRVGRLPSGELSFATVGMKALGLLEIECTAPPEEERRVMDRVFNVAHYLCDKGPVLNDGDTFGRSATEKIRVSHRPSAWKREGTVVFLEFPG